MSERAVVFVLALVMSVGVAAVSLIVAVVVHELGHVVAGYVVGLRVARIHLGPLEIRDHGRPRVRLVWSLQAGGVLVPFDRTAALGPLRWGLIVSTAAGPRIRLRSGRLLFVLSGGLRLGDPPSVPQAI